MRTKYLKGLRVGEPAAACRREKDVKIWILLLSGTCLLLPSHLLRHLIVPRNAKIVAEEKRSSISHNSVLANFRQTLFNVRSFASHNPQLSFSQQLLIMAKKGGIKEEDIVLNK